jgi:hypothetical protein
MAALVAMYAAIKQCAIERSGGTDKQKSSARHMLWRKVVTIVTTSYTVGAIFFVRSFLRPFDCVDDGTGRMFMESAPQIECVEGYDSERASNYPSIKYLASLGLVVFMGGFAVLCACLLKAHKTGDHSLGSLSFLGGAVSHVYGFMFSQNKSSTRTKSQSHNIARVRLCADKYEDQYYYWEMVVVVRKVLLVAIFLLFDTVLSVLLATAVTMVSIGIQIAARPFEDAGTDWTETLSLAAQLFLLVAGPVFKVLVSAHDLLVYLRRG